MKKNICKCSQIIAVLLFSVNVMAQTSISYHLGASKPLGDFANSRAEDRYDVIWLDYDSEKGGAGMGLNLGVKMKSDIAAIEGLGFIFTTDVFYNGANADVKEWKSEELEADENEYDDVKLTLPKWLNIPMMVGLNYEYAINDDFGIWTEFGAGANLGKLTNLKDFCEIDNEEYTYKEVYEFKVSAAFQLGVGVKLSDKISMGVHYYSFGNRRIEGQYFFEGDSDDYDEDGKFKSEYITPTMLTFRIGYHF